jgi:HK97 family phage prohead protease
MMLHKNNHATIEHLSGLELKFVASGTAGIFSGHAAAFGSKDSHGDIIRSGSFAQTIAAHHADGRMPPFLMAHDQARPIGKITSMQEDPHGLAVDGQFNMATTAGRDACAHCKAGDVSGLSIGYTVPSGGAVQAKDGTRTLQRVHLHEVSLVSLPSNGQSRIHEVKMLATPDELEALLRNAGLSKRAAEAVAAHGFTGLSTKAAPEIDIDRVADLLRRHSLEYKNWN